MWKSLLALVTAALFSAAALGQSSGDIDDYLKPGHPDTYVVQKGDTLWDISGRFLQKPWQWPWPSSRT